MPEYEIDSVTHRNVLCNKLINIHNNQISILGLSQQISGKVMLTCYQLTTLTILIHIKWINLAWFAPKGYRLYNVVKNFSFTL